jgi:hypothetical protein
MKVVDKKSVEHVKERDCSWLRSERFQIWLRVIVVVAAPEHAHVMTPAYAYG